MKIFVFCFLLIGCLSLTTAARTRFARQTRQILDCIRTCPTATSEYNPICGSNGITYDNQSKLDCARNVCGVQVSAVRRGNCGSFN